MFTDDPWLDKPMKVAVTNSELTSAVSAAVSGWNAVRPSGIEAMVSGAQVSTADLTINYQVCPGVDADLYTACWTSVTWTTPSTHESKLWYKSSIYIRPSGYIVASGAYSINYGTNALNGTVAHEMGHPLGFGDQYIWWNDPVCNSAVTSVMDGAYVTGTGSPKTVVLCDNHVPNIGFDKDLWRRYQTVGRYLTDIILVYGDGRVRTAWYDNAWNDYVMYLRWQRGSTPNGPWLQFAETYHIGKNGSHYVVPGANTAYWRVEGSIYPTAYGVNYQYIRVCSKPIFNYVYITPATEERCMPVLWFQNPL